MNMKSNGTSHICKFNGISDEIQQNLFKPLADRLLNAVRYEQSFCGGKGKSLCFGLHPHLLAYGGQKG